MKEITRVHTERSISACHFLPRYSGKCSALHGHSWVIKVDVYAPINLETGMIIDFVDLKKIIDEYDHDYFNKPQRGQKEIENPTAENLMRYFALQIVAKLTEKREDFTKIVVQVYESPESFAEVIFEVEE